MKLLKLIPAFLLLATAMTAQAVKKYVLLEHFTNSKCSICASKNPGFYTLINQAQYDGNLHHISFHPSIPYNTCIFYLANPTENNTRTSYYGIQGTPRVALNGTLAPLNGPLLSASTLDATLNQTSPLYLQVSETGNGTVRTATIKARTVANIPPGNYKIYFAIVEKTINYNAPNGETVHHDVFRKMLPDINGMAFTPAALGQETEFIFYYDLNANWVSNEVYLIAFVQNTVTNEVLNSGTRFDPVVSATGEAADIQSLTIFPNPVQDEAMISLDGDRANQVQVYAMDGRLVKTDFSSEQESVVVPTHGFAPGVYFVKVKGEKGMYSGKLVKE